MGRKKQPTVEEAPKSDGVKQMILRLPTEKHSWIKDVSESTGLTHPNVILYIIGQAMKFPAADYVEEISKFRKAQLRDEIHAKQQELKAQLEKLEQELK
jgi:hypothetical protein